MAVIIVHTAIINRQGKILVLRRSLKEKVLPGFWDLPGGTVWLKENPLAGAIREVKEECGLKISNLKPLALTSNWDRIKKDNFVTLIFYSKNYQGQIKLDYRDHDDYAWLKKAEIKKLKAVPYLKSLDI